MRASYIWLFIKAAVAVALLATCTTIVLGQETAEKAHKADKAAHKGQYKEFCSAGHSNGDKAGFRELREMSVPATGRIAVDGGTNGGIKVKGENRSDVAIRACVQTWADTEDAARALAQSIRINTAGTIKADSSAENGWSVSYQLLVPRGTDLDLRAHNGGIAISSVDGRMEFATTNGGVSLQDVSGDVKGRTTNGGVSVMLAGNSWRGSGLDVETSNGGVHLSIPSSYAANLETGTVNGGFKSDIAALNVTTENVSGNERFGGRRGVKINTAINGGGAPIRVVTTNGGIRISTTDTEVF